ncbi:MAG: hypothetical protein L0J86_03930, partial [Corynebacterium sp.]|nr:hypothetical protein [Corynebacterium sp.]
MTQPPPSESPVTDDPAQESPERRQAGGRGLTRMFGLLPNIGTAGSRSATLHTTSPAAPVRRFTGGELLRLR